MSITPATVASFAGVLLGAFGVVDPNTDSLVKAIAAGGTTIIAAVYTWQEHRTTRNADNAAAAAHRPVFAPGTIVVDVEKFLETIGKSFTSPEAKALLASVSVPNTLGGAHAAAPSTPVVNPVDGAHA